ncbi:hypothetical protein [Tumebacillus permanentifrigoris]|uniref:Uncharacterized protein n=1 Tax=Tumebacillus permanentifrigoris TaxID=378543 RepID=A0A316DBX8_9BACL|nr:hypothetical protein [Tumebacillus permanentifrigoris]PWK15647.1 hypothetical protein C7459_103187 [Tumebacillus permanentifrigoris]
MKPKSTSTDEVKGDEWMAKDKRMVEHGYDPKIAQDPARGTILMLDAFVDFEAADLAKIVEFAEVRNFAQIVLFPHHEKTAKNMGWTELPAFHKRLKAVDAMVDDLPSTAVRVTVDNWEEKRKKYTPLELILRYFEEKYRPPYFLYVTDGYANAMAQFASFDECMKKVRLVIDQKYDVPAHPKLTKVEHRWEYVE